MSKSIELMVLGVLMEGPASAYDVDKSLEQRNLRRWISVSTPSVYRHLLKLSDAGMIDGETVREGLAPEKTVYQINAEGRERFKALMDDIAGESARIGFPFLPVVANLRHLDIRSRKEIIRSIRDEYAAKAVVVRQRVDDYTTPDARVSMELYVRAYELVAEWMDEVERKFTRE